MLGYRSFLMLGYSTFQKFATIYKKGKSSKSVNTTPCEELKHTQSLQYESALKARSRGAPVEVLTLVVESSPFHAWFKWVLRNFSVLKHFLFADFPLKASCVGDFSIWKLVFMSPIWWLHMHDKPCWNHAANLDLVHLQGGRHGDYPKNQRRSGSNPFSLP